MDKQPDTKQGDETKTLVDAVETNKDLTKDSQVPEQKTQEETKTPEVEKNPKEVILETRDSGGNVTGQVRADGTVRGKDPRGGRATPIKIKVKVDKTPEEDEPEGDRFSNYELAILTGIPIHRLDKGNLTPAEISRVIDLQR